MQAAGFDFLIREPVHPAALRVLLLRALYRGAEARRAPRVACGHPVTFKTGFWRQKATLIDLSPRGCRLLVAKPVKEKSELTLQIPKDLAGGRPLELVGHAVRVVPAERECGRDGETIVGVRFAPVEGDTRTRLRALLSERVLGPAILSASAAQPSPESARASASRRPTRVHKRAPYDRKVTAMDGNDGYMLMCRDISVGGMRIEPVEGLVVGSRLELAVQLSAREEPFLVDATVVRDDGELGLALQFAWIAPEAHERLHALLEKLPSIEGLQDDSRSQGTFLAQRLSREPSPSD
jgi:c-di-GMP-binding flagellar brake protein YcgR